ncbi:MAG TPA: ABC transporter ATP-binding protein [Oscillospiraceae bacterium]|nr:ABC transporter ATP-binding protein [Oscillospiraceae bacterium]HPS34628.1 ABC transporter ATP-binding protein [Oscillospiraceae bacterium]
MADRTPPPAGMGGSFGPPNRGQPVVKPKNMRGTLSRLWSLTDKNRKGLGWILLLSTLTSASAILSPLVIGNAVTAVDEGNPAKIILFTLIALYLCDSLVRFLQQFFMASIGQRIIHHIRVTLFSTMKKLPLSFFDRCQHGELMSRLTNDVDNISNTISNSLTQLLTFLFTIVGILCIMLSLSPLLTTVSLVGVGLIFLMTRVITKRTRKLFAEQQKALGKLNGQVEESVSGLSVVKAFCREDKMISEFDESNEALCKVATRALIWSGFLMPIMNVINNLSFVAISVISGIMAIRGTIDIGMISSFLLYSRQFSRPFVEIANIYNNFQTAVAGAERVFEIMDEQPEPEDIPDALPLVAPKGDIELQNVDFGYDKERPILKDVSLKIPAGTKAAIVGPTGAGKTTIINLLTRFYDVTGGKILLDGHDLRDYKMEDLRRSFGVVLQDTALFAESVRSNISYGRDDVSMADIEKAAKIAGADGFIRRLPEGYNTVLTQGGIELSQGERQLLTIARAVLTNAPILILDEATSSVDTVTEQKIRRAMLTITEGRTSFIIAHRLTTIRDSDIIILIEGGRIAEQGTHRELMAQNGQYASMCRTQMGEA